LIGALLALPIDFLLRGGAGMMGARVMLPAWLLAATTGVTLLTALASSLSALRLVRRVEPVLLLH
jgi:hypothetical protein